MKLLDAKKAWYVVRSNIKCEAKAEESLRLAGFEVYVPRFRVEIKNKRTNTFAVRERPLMMRYMFVGMERGREHFGFIRSCDGVESILGVNGKPIPVRGEDVEAIQIAEFDMRFDDTRAARIHRKEEAETRKQTLEMKFSKGRIVEITDGPFASFTAVVEEVTKQGNVKAMLELFGGMASVEFHAAQLSPAA